MAEPKFVDPSDAIFALVLQRPIKPFGVVMEQVFFREPNAGDITRVGMPVQHVPGDGPDGISFNAAKMTAMMARLSMVPESTIDTMTAQDWAECAWGLARFFIPGLPTKPVAQPSSSPNTSAATPSIS